MNPVVAPCGNSDSLTSEKAKIESTKGAFYNEEAIIFNNFKALCGTTINFFHFLLHLFCALHHFSTTGKKKQAFKRNLKKESGSKIRRVWNRHAGGP